MRVRCPAFPAFLVLCALLACLSACKPALLTPEEFLQAHIDALHEMAPDLKAEVAGNLELKITGDATVVRVPLQKNYDTYVQEPDRLDELRQRFARGMSGAAAGSKRKSVTGNIIPVIKRREWLAGKEGYTVSETLSPDLVVVYAEDRPDTTHYLSLSEIEQAGIVKDSLRPQAVENLLRILEIQAHSGNGSIMLTAGGDYEASLILADSILKGYEDDVKGSLVVAIPASNLLLLTGSENREGLALLRQTSEEQREKGTLLGPNLFLYKNGKLTEIPPEG